MLPSKQPDMAQVFTMHVSRNKYPPNYQEQHGWTMTNYKGTGNFTVEQAFVIQN